jgi:hypothetical protein
MQSVCAACRQSRRIFQLNEKQRVPETAAFCTVCLARAHLPSMADKLEHKKSELEAVAAPLRRERASLPANLEYQNYDRLLASYAKRRRPRAASAAPSSSATRSSSAVPSSSALLTSSSNESLGGSSSSDDVGSAHVSAAPPVVAMPNDQLAELRRARETVLSFPLARTVVQEDLYLPSGDENSSAAANQAEAVFRNHRERQQQLEEFARPNPLHMKMLEEQERRRGFKQAADKRDLREPNVQNSKEGGTAVVRRRAMTVPDHGSSARGNQDEHIDRATSTMPWSVSAPRATTDAFRSDLYARF